jgi:hypothetical protein
MKIAQFIVRTILAIIFLVILYHFALNGRYQAVGDSPYLIDKWTNTVSMPKNWEKFTKEVNKLNNNTSSEEQQTNENYEE